MSDNVQVRPTTRKRAAKHFSTVAAIEPPAVVFLVRVDHSLKRTEPPVRAAGDDGQGEE